MLRNPAGGVTIRPAKKEPSREVGMGIHRRIVRYAVALAATAVVATSVPASAQDFYKGKTLTIIVGFSPGGGFDRNARLLARYIGDHIPGKPDVVVQNMPGAGSLKSVKHLLTIAPKDGTVIDTFNFGLIGQSRLTPKKVPVDFRKVAWIGSISRDLSVCYTWHTLGIKTMADLKKRKTVHIGLTAPGANEDIHTHILKNIFGVDVHQVGGYPGSAEERIAIERGELDGGCGAWSSIPPAWVAKHNIDPIYRSLTIVPPDLPPGVPYVMDLAANDRDRAIIRVLISGGEVGRPYIAPPEVPAARVKILRDAFAATVKDPRLLAEAEKARLPVSPAVGPEAVEIVDAIYAAPADIVDAARKVITQ
jgi:tripartite-type tricarboxylate transporter receptor subunit TctC